MRYVKKSLKNLWQQALIRVVIQFSVLDFARCFGVGAVKVSAFLCL